MLSLFMLFSHTVSVASLVSLAPVAARAVGAFSAVSSVHIRLISMIQKSKAKQYKQCYQFWQAGKVLQSVDIIRRSISPDGCCNIRSNEDFHDASLYRKIHPVMQDCICTCSLLLQLTVLTGTPVYDGDCYMDQYLWI